MNELKLKENIGWFKMRNLFIDVYAEHIGYVAVAIYVCLRRYADNKTKIAFPSHKTIAKKLSMNERTVTRHLKKLESYGFITKQKARHLGKWLHNVYTLSPPSRWLNPHDFKLPKPDD